MTMRTATLITSSRTIVATARVVDEGDYFGGTIDLRETPPDLRILFEEFEEIVDGQMFVFLDDIQNRIGILALKVVFETGEEVSIEDVQVFPSTGDVSFRLAAVPCSQQESGLTASRIRLP